MKGFFLAIAAMGVVAPSAGVADEPNLANGVVVVGVKADFAPDFTWRPFDPTTGKLLPFKVVRNITQESKKQLSSLFSGLGRLGRRDKRYDSNSAGVSYRMAELPPGTYVLETIAVPGVRMALNGQVPIVRIAAGRTTYVGDYLIERDKKKGGRASDAGRSFAEARAFLAAFPKVTEPLTDDGSGAATFDCFGKLVPFASQLVCDSNKSLVSNIAFLGSADRLAPPPAD